MDIPGRFGYRRNRFTAARIRRAEAPVNPAGNSALWLTNYRRVWEAIAGPFMIAVG